MISTHTPAWGVTAALQLSQMERVISTHTPAWGVTLQYLRLIGGAFDFNSHARVGRDDCPAHPLNALVNFNSHARVGRDRNVSFLRPVCLQISTHTPAWGVTGWWAI